MREHSDRALDLVITVKSLRRAKSRLLGAADRGIGDRAAHETLALALVRDTATAALATPNVRKVLVVTSDPTVADTLAADGVATTPDLPDLGLNAAVAHGAELLRLADPNATVGVLQSDLPALRSEELAAALTESAGRRAFCADRQGTGTTLLIAPAGTALDPRFGPGSAAAHTESGAVLVGVDLPTLRCDVDTAEDLTLAATMGVGRHTAAVIGMSSCARPA
ncbi:MAG TPA: 2-phospho-L-lactate guanylyltransferase [Pseudonocardiaceae bacterium]|nr:2-phospho-L-lactate guanylyltransferase [Pseudonocardiaceae bacterium]